MPRRSLYACSSGGTYSEGLKVVDREVVAEEVEESILKHAAVAVAAGRRKSQQPG
jgi:hypothetical protein